MTATDEVYKVKVITNIKQLPSGVNLYGVQASKSEDAWTKLQAAAKRKSRRLDVEIIQWGGYYYGQFLPEKS